MTTLETLKLALEALEGIHPGNMTPMAEEAWNKAITALRQAIEQAEQIEALSKPCLCGKQTQAWCMSNTCTKAEQAQPVATKLETQQFNCFHVSAEDFQKLKALPVGTKIYTAPPPRQPLLASDIVTMYDENPRSDSEMIAFARAIEAAHGITGETK